MSWFDDDLMSMFDCEDDLKKRKSRAGGSAVLHNSISDIDSLLQRGGGVSGVVLSQNTGTPHHSDHHHVAIANDKDCGDKNALPHEIEFHDHVVVLC